MSHNIQDLAFWAGKAKKAAGGAALLGLFAGPAFSQNASVPPDPRISTLSWSPIDGRVDVQVMRPQTDAVSIGWGLDLNFQAFPVHPLAQSEGYSHLASVRARLSTPEQAESNKDWRGHLTFGAGFSRTLAQLHPHEVGGSPVYRKKSFYDYPIEMSPLKPVAFAEACISSPQIKPLRGARVEACQRIATNGRVNSVAFNDDNPWPVESGGGFKRSPTFKLSWGI